MMMKEDCVSTSVILIDYIRKSVDFAVGEEGVYIISQFLICRDTLNDNSSFISALQVNCCLL